MNRRLSLALSLVRGETKEPYPPNGAGLVVTPEYVCHSMRTYEGLRAPIHMIMDTNGSPSTPHGSPMMGNDMPRGQR